MGIRQFITRLREAIAYEVTEAQRMRALVGQLRSEVAKLTAALNDTQAQEEDLAAEFEAILKEIEGINTTPVADGLIQYVEAEPVIVTPADVAQSHGDVAPGVIPEASVADSAVTGIESLLMSNPIDGGEINASVPEFKPVSDPLETQPDTGEDPEDFEEMGEDLDNPQNFNDAANGIIEEDDDV